jgi:CubicO group peptidase (beta-lactamase class C family)
VNTVDPAALQTELDRLAKEYDVPGVAVGVIHDGVEHYAFTGVTSVANPLPVDASTLFQFGSTGKTFTATAIMILVEQGKLSLDDLVVQHVPALTLREPGLVDKVTIRHLLNHTAGWDGDFFPDTGTGDDALEKYVALMADLEMAHDFDQAVSYNNASFVLAGHVIEKLTGKPFPQAIRELVIEPLGLTGTIQLPADLLRRRFAVGHTLVDDVQTVVPHVMMPHSCGPAGGISGTAADQIAWAKLHLGIEGDGAPLLTRASVELMQQPTVECKGLAIADAIGLSWLLSDVEGTKVVRHGGTTYGQFSAFVLVPELGFGFISMTNGGPGGSALNKALEAWAMKAYLGLEKEKPVPVDASPETLATVLGTYETLVSRVEITASDGRLVLVISPKEADPEAEQHTPQPPLTAAFIDGDPDGFVVVGGLTDGLLCRVLRDGVGTVTAVNLGGRIARRTS